VPENAVSEPQNRLPVIVVHGPDRAAWLVAHAPRFAKLVLHEADDAWSGLRAAQRADPDAEVLLIAAGAQLPERALARLIQGARDAGADVVSALDGSQALSPFAAARGLDPDAEPAAVDAGVALFGSRRAIASAHYSTRLSLWRPAALAWVSRSQNTPVAELPEGLSGVLIDTLFVGDGHAAHLIAAGGDDPRDPPPAGSLDVLRSRFAPLASTVPVRPGLDGRPVLLHLLHSWGGGAERFVRDLAQADQQHCHLLLLAHGSSARRRFGERYTLQLAAHPELGALRAWTLDRPIVTTAIEHAAYRQMLAAISRDFALDALIVSSLIGHSLDALRSALRTLIVTHDYYPLWPHLHADFGAAAECFAPAQLDQALRDAARGPLAWSDASEFELLRDAYVAAVQAANVTLIAPTDGVRANQQRIAPALAGLDWRVIEHGLAPFSEPPMAIEAPARQRPRLLVLGRINGGKGVDLLRQLLPLVTPLADVHLLGCGKAGEAFFGAPRVDIELDYARDQLPALLARIAPDLALAPVSVAETFSYTLSELRACGIPLLASRLGSLAERIEDGRDGFLAQPTAADFARRIADLLADPSALDAVRGNLRNGLARTTSAMASDYAGVLALARHRAVRARMPAPTAAELALYQPLIDGDHWRAQAASQAQQITAQQRELVTRAQWVFELETQFEARSAWAFELERSLQLSQATAQQEIKRLNQLVGQDSEWSGALEQALDLSDQRVAELSQGLAGTQAQLAETEQTIVENQRMIVESQRMIAERTEWAQRLDAQISTIHASKSWWLTKPLRVAGRFGRRVLASLGFRARRIKADAGRLRASLAMRGWRGTFAHVRQLRARHTQLDQALPSTPLIAAAPNPDRSPFALAVSAQPTVSIVIPVYNHLDHTLTCLRSIAEHPGAVAFEVIVVDDCSSDDSAAMLATVDGLRLLRNVENTGFIGACNAGLNAANGEFVVFLNNDTAVRPGWLEALIGTFTARPDCGLVGAKLIYPDGRLQEAGGIVFNDGSGWNYGRFDDPRAPQYNYLREVDYCSGAAIMLRRELLEDFGGFDPRYAPAYYEDTDLAFRVRERGLKCWYQPAAEVIHFEGVSSGTDTGSGIKRFQVVNQETFRQRWREALSAQPAPGTAIEVAREHRARGRILIIDACTPEPDKDSGSLRMLNLMRILVEGGWKLTFLSQNRLYVPHYTAQLQQLGVEVLYLPYVSDVPQWIEQHAALLDWAIVSRHYVASAFEPLLRKLAPQVRIVFDTVDLHFLREQRAAELEPERTELKRAAAQTRAAELALMAQADVTLVVSPAEQELLKNLLPQARIEVLSNVHQLAPPGPDFGARRDLWFVGGFQHPPNVDAMQWFIAQVWPLIAVALPDARFHVVGSRMPESLAAIAGERVIYHGFVEDLSPFLDGCRLAVAPLRYGAGVKGKVNQSMAHGQPVVATSVAVEGMYLAHEVSVLVADRAEEFAAAAVRLYDDPELWQRLAEGGRANVAEHFSFASARSALQRVLG